MPTSTLPDDFYHTLVVNVSDAWAEISMQTPPTQAISFLREAFVLARQERIQVGAVGVFQDPSLSLRSDRPIMDAFTLLKQLGVELSRVKVYAVCEESKQHAVTEEVRLAGGEASLVTFDVVNLKAIA